ncbi:MAG: hypothetical protein AABZ22_09475, partial [Nitrospirota bacterium]
DIRRSLGKLVSIKLRRPYNGQWRVAGRLVDANERGVTVAFARSDPEQTLDVEWEAIAEARLEVEF